MNFIELLIILYVLTGFFFVFLATIVFGNKKIIETISPLMNANTSMVIHHFVFFTLVFGFLLPKPYLKYHIVVLIIGFLHWHTNNQRCILTDIHKKIIKNDDYTFFRTTLFQNTITKEQAFYFSYFIFTISLCISITRVVVGE